MVYFDSDVNLTLMDFLWEISSSTEYDYVILMTRKMYSFFRSYQISPKEKPIIIASDAIPFLKDKLKDQRILIVDDIRIHGRTVAWISDELSSSNNAPRSIDYKVFIIDESSVSELDNNIGAENDFTYHLSLPRSMWRKISRQIIERIRGTLTPLRYSVCYAHVPICVQQEEIVQRLNLVKIKNCDPEYDVVDSYIWNPRSLNNPEFYDGILDSLCIRIDFSKHCPGVALVVPQVILKPLCDSDVTALFSEISSKKVPEEVHPEGACRFFEYAVSQWAMIAIAKELAQQLDLQNGSYVLNDSDLSYCCDNELITYARDVDFFARFERILKHSIKPYSLSINKGNAMEMIGRITAPKGTMGYLRFLCESGFADELLCTLKERKRIDGARVQYLLQRLNVTLEDIIYALTMSITTYRYISAAGWTTMRVIPGESAFSYMLFENKKVVIKTQDEIALSKLNGEIDKHEIVARFNQFCESTSEDLFADVFTILQSLEEFMKKQNKNTKIKDDDDTRFRYIQYMIDIGVFRSYSSAS